MYVLSAGISGVFAIALASGRSETLSSSPYQALNFAMYVGIMLWSAGESFAYWIPMRRRLKLQLCEAVVANRVLLWGLATGAAGIGIAIGAYGVLGQVPGSLPPTWVSVNFAAFGSVSAICFWLAFNPPAVYARWIERRAAVFAIS